MEKILVTGSEGFIGSHLVELLATEGYNVTAFVLYNSFDYRGWLDDVPADLQDNIQVVFGDVRDPTSVRYAMAGCEAVIHLAALIGIPYSYSAPESYVDTNIRGTLNVLQAARDLGVNRVIHTSTSEVYGTAQFVPITEGHPLMGQSPYSASKIAADQLAWSFWSSFDLPVTIIRPFNTYGPRQSTRAVIPTIITQVASGRREVDLGDTSTTRDFSFVQDTARAFVDALTAPQSIGETINLGAGFEMSISDVVQEIGRIMGEQLTTTQQAERIRPEKSEVKRLLPDNSLAKNLLGWSPEFGGIEGFRRGLEKTIEWFVSPDNLAKYRPGSYTL